MLIFYKRVSANIDKGKLKLKNLKCLVYCVHLLIDTGIKIYLFVNISRSFDRRIRNFTGVLGVYPETPGFPGTMRFAQSHQNVA